MILLVAPYTGTLKCSVKAIDLRAKNRRERKKKKHPGTRICLLGVCHHQYDTLLFVVFLLA